MKNQHMMILHLWLGNVEAKSVDEIETRELPDK